MMAAEPAAEYGNYIKDQSKTLTASLICTMLALKTTARMKWMILKMEKLTFLFVYNMLLTGFDAKRLKKLYLGRLSKIITCCKHLQG
jgi:type I restriction enzyme R subunit